jgi:hypothetical protein
MFGPRASPHPAQVAFGPRFFFAPHEGQSQYPIRMVIAGAGYVMLRRLRTGGTVAYHPES